MMPIATTPRTRLTTLIIVPAVLAMIPPMIEVPGKGIKMMPYPTTSTIQVGLTSERFWLDTVVVGLAVLVISLSIFALLEVTVPLLLQPH